MAVKKSTARRTTTSSSKKVVKKSSAKAKKSVTKKATTKKATAKKAAVKKSAVKKAAAKKPATKKAAVKKSAAKKSTSSAASLSVPAVPVGQVRTATRVNVATTPAPAKPAKPTAPAQKNNGGSSRTFLVLVFAIVLLGLIVWSKSSSNTEEPTSTATATATATAEATPSQSASAEPSESAQVTDGTSSSPAPERFIGNFRNGGQTLLLTWRAPAGGEGITGYNVEVRPANGEWTSVEVVGADVFSYQLQKVSTDSWSQFRVSAVYPDGQASAKIFGFAGQWSK